MIEISKVSKSYNAGSVVDAVTLELPDRAITSIIGPNGAGKSTLLAMMSRLLAIDSGWIKVGGLDVSTTPGDTLAKRLSILRQENTIGPRLSVRELVAFGRYPHSKGRPCDEDRNHVERAIACLGLEAFAARFLDELSGGQRQRAFIAMILCQDTDYMLLDEPLNSLDMKHATAVMKRFRHAVDTLGKTIVLVLHDLNFASCYSDYIVAMKRGKVVSQGTPDEIMRPAILRDIYETDIAIERFAGKPIAVYYF